MNLVRGPWALPEHGYNLEADEQRRQAVEEITKKELADAELMGYKIGEYELGIINNKLWQRGLLHEHEDVCSAYPEFFKDEDPRGLVVSATVIKADFEIQTAAEASEISHDAVA